MNKSLISVLVVMLLMSVSVLAVYPEEYANNLSVSCENVTAGTPIVVNGSAGFNLEGESNQIVWVQCQPDLYLYWNTYDDYSIGTLTEAVPMECEKNCQVPNVNPKDVWSDYIAVFHFSDLNDSTNSNYTLSPTGSPAFVSGVFGDRLQSSPGNYVTGGVFNSDSCDQLTYELWIDPSGTQNSGSDNWAVFHQESGSCGSTGLMWNYDTATLDWNFKCHSNFVSTTNDPQHTAITHDGTYYEVYVDGELKSQIATSRDLGGGGSNLMVGGGNNAVYGTYDELRFSCEAKTPEYMNETYFNKLGITGYGTLGVGEELPPPTYNSSNYTNHLPIYCSNITSGTPMVLNGSGGFDLGNGENIVWFKCGPNLSLHYNNYSDYVIGTNDTQSPMEVEVGDGTSFEPSLVWSDYKVVYHMTNQNDSTSARYDLTLGGSPSFVSGVFGDQLQIPTSNDYAVRAVHDSDECAEYTYELWVDPVSTFQSGGDNWALFHRENGGCGSIGLMWNTDNTSLHWNLNCLDISIATTNESQYDLVLYNGTHYNAYIDGEQEASILESRYSTPWGATGGTELWIGDGADTNNGLTGTYDEIRISCEAKNSGYPSQVYYNKLGANGFGTFTDYIESCEPNWTCSGYGDCLENDTQVCNETTDLNVCGVPYTGDFTEFEPQACDFCTPLWMCVGYDSCLENNTQVCNETEDFNTCGETYTGNYSEFELNVCDFCTPDWNCSSFDECVGGTQMCLNVTDLNTCGESFGGLLEDYDESCEVEPPITGYVATFGTGDLPRLFSDLVGNGLYVLIGLAGVVVLGVVGYFGVTQAQKTMKEVKGK